MKKTMFAGLTIVATIAVVMVGLAVIPVAYAIHNGEGHSDKLSLGECYRTMAVTKMDARPARMIGKRVEKLIEDHQTETRTESQQIQTSMVEHNLKPSTNNQLFFFTGKMSNY